MERVIGQKATGGKQDERLSYHLLIVDSDVVDIKSRYDKSKETQSSQ